MEICRLRLSKNWRWSSMLIGVVVVVEEWSWCWSNVLSGDDEGWTSGEGDGGGG